MTRNHLIRCTAIGAFAILAANGSLPACAQSGTVDVERSRIYIFVAKKGAGHEHGVEGRVASGAIHFGRSDQAGSLTFDLRTFQADTAAARRFFNLPGETDADTQSQVNANMRGEAVLDVGKFPTAEFAIHSVQASQAKPNVPGQPYELVGDFMLHGVRKPLQFVAGAESVGGLVRLRGRFSMKQTDFGIKPFSKFLGAVGVADELQVYGDLWIRP